MMIGIDYQKTTVRSN